MIGNRIILMIPLTKINKKGVLKKSPNVFLCFVVIVTATNSCFTKKS